MTGISTKDRLGLRVSRFSHRIRANLPELVLTGVVTSSEVVFLEALAASLPAPVAAGLAFLTATLTWLGVHGVRVLRREKPPSPPGHLPFPDRGAPFLGREADLRRVVDRARERGIVVIRGGPGRGTSTLAVHCAWALAPKAGGQRYADVRGPDRDRPESPLSVAQRVLRTLDRPPGAILTPDDAGPEVLNALEGTGQVLLLDNVSSWRQVAWLPPRIPGAHLVVAGELTDEVPRHVQPIELDPLAPEAGERLLAAYVDEPRIRRDERAVRRLITACSGNPAEIVRVGRWLARNPEVALSALADDLARLPIDEKLTFLLRLNIGQLRPTAKQLLVLLAGLPIAEIDHRAAAALLGLPSAEGPINELSERGLLENVRITRVRVTSAFRDAGVRDPDQDATAWRRLTEYYAEQVDLYAARLPAEEARAWFALEDRTLLQILARDPAVPKTGRALRRVAEGLEAWFRLEQRHKDRLPVAELLARAAKVLGDRHAQASAELRQSMILLTMGLPDQARRRFDRAAALRGRAESWPPELHLGHAAILLATGDELSAVESALVRHGQAARADDPLGTSIRYLNAAALLLRQAQLLPPDDAQRRYADARSFLYEALALAERATDTAAAAHAHELLGIAHQRLGRPFEADRHWAEAEELYGGIGDEIGRARCQVHRAVALADGPGSRRDEAEKLLDNAVPRLPSTGLSTAVANLHLSRLRPSRAREYRDLGLAALAPWDGIAEPRQVTEIRRLLTGPGTPPDRPVRRGRSA